MLKKWLKVDKYIITIVFIIIFCQFFFSDYFDQIDSFKKTATENVDKINLQSDIDNYTNNYIKTYSYQYLDLMGQIEYDAFSNLYQFGNNEFTLDKNYTATLGNIYGENASFALIYAKSEINYAFGLDNQFLTFSNNLPGISNIYYMSNSNFIYLWPFENTDRLKSFYNNYPLKNEANSGVITWSHVYNENGKKTNTVQIPIIFNNFVKGFVGMDFHTENHYSYITPNYNFCIFNGYGEALASNVIDVDKVDKTTNDFLGKNYKKLLNKKSGSIVFLNGKIYYYKDFVGNNLYVQSDNILMLLWHSLKNYTSNCTAFFSIYNNCFVEKSR